MDIALSPSLICMDLCNLASEVQEIEQLGYKMLHVDIIDGHFSPDFPLGIGTLKQLRLRTDLILDAHLMATDNAPYVDMLLDSGVDRLCFHMDYEPRPSILLRKIKAAGCKAGLAVSPETPLSLINPLLCLCDFVLIMRIDAGYAHLPGTQVYPHINDKIRELAEYAKVHMPQLEISVDGRVTFEDIAELARLGVNTFVCGTKSTFYPHSTRKENWEHIQSVIER